MTAEGRRRRCGLLQGWTSRCYDDVRLVDLLAGVAVVQPLTGHLDHTRRHLHTHTHTRCSIIIGYPLLDARRTFALHGPMVWNSLTDDLRAQQD